MTVWRLSRERYASDGRTAFDGFGAAQRGGRWNSRGVPLAYACDSRALAMLEYLVHLEMDDAPSDLLNFRADVPDDAILEQTTYPTDWAIEPHGRETQHIGDAWVRSRASLALSVRSVIVPEQVNVLVNPAHRRFSEIAFERPTPCRFDPRLLE